MVQVPVVHHIHHVLMEDLLEEFEVDYHSGDIVRLALKRDLYYIIVTMAVT